MKRAISMLVAIVMVLSMVPTVFAASETAIIVEDSPLRCFARRAQRFLILLESRDLESNLLHLFRFVFLTCHKSNQDGCK